MARRQRLPSLNTRIRARRRRTGLTGAALAQRAGISASYVSLIETGAKVPDEEVAGRLARALGDDEELYRAWARASRLGLHRLPLLSRIDAISRSATWADMFERGERLPALAEPRRAPAAGAAAPERANAPDEEAAEILRVPVLADAADPGRSFPSPLAVCDRVLVDRRLVGDHVPERLFAYEVTAANGRHLRGIAAPGDRIVFRRGGSLAADRICAVRTPRGVVLSRVLLKGRALLLLPGEGERDFESVEVKDVNAIPGVIAGTHVLLIRR